MTDLIGRALHRLGQQLPGRVSMPGDNGYAAATAIWAKPRRPRSARCRPLPDTGRHPVGHSSRARRWSSIVRACRRPRLGRSRAV
jgi:hypothetical protein